MEPIEGLVNLYGNGDYLKMMNRKDASREAAGTVSPVVPTMITTFGMTDGMYSDMITVELTPDSLFD